MINSSVKQAILIVTNRISKDVIKRYNKLREATTSSADVFLLYHHNDNNEVIEVEGIKIEIRH